MTERNGIHHQRRPPDVEEALSSMLWTPYERSTPTDSSSDDDDERLNKKLKKSQSHYEYRSVSSLAFAPLNHSDLNNFNLFADHVDITATSSTTNVARHSLNFSSPYVPFSNYNNQNAATIHHNQRHHYMNSNNYNHNNSNNAFKLINHKNYESSKSNYRNSYPYYGHIPSLHKWWSSSNVLKEPPSYDSLFSKSSTLATPSPTPTPTVSITTSSSSSSTTTENNLQDSSSNSLLTSQANRKKGAIKSNGSKAGNSVNASNAMGFADTVNRVGFPASTVTTTTGATDYANNQIGETPLNGRLVNSFTDDYISAHTSSTETLTSMPQEYNAQQHYHVAQHVPTNADFHTSHSTNTNTDTNTCSTIAKDVALHAKQIINNVNKTPLVQKTQEHNENWNDVKTRSKQKQQNFNNSFNNHNHNHQHSCNHIQNQSNNRNNNSCCNTKKTTTNFMKTLQQQEKHQQQDLGNCKENLETNEREQHQQKQQCIEQRENKENLFLTNGCINSTTTITTPPATPLTRKRRNNDRVSQPSSSTLVLSNCNGNAYSTLATNVQCNGGAGGVASSSPNSLNTLSNGNSPAFTPILLQERQMTRYKAINCDDISDDIVDDEEIVVECNVVDRAVQTVGTNSTAFSLASSFEEFGTSVADWSRIKFKSNDKRKTFHVPQSSYYCDEVSLNANSTSFLTPNKCLAELERLYAEFRASESLIERKLNAAYKEQDSSISFATRKPNTMRLNVPPASSIPIAANAATCHTTNDSKVVNSSNSFRSTTNINNSNNYHNHNDNSNSCVTNNVSILTTTSTIDNPYNTTIQVNDINNTSTTTANTNHINNNNSDINSNQNNTSDFSESFFNQTNKNLNTNININGNSNNNNNNKNNIKNQTNFDLIVNQNIVNNNGGVSVVNCNYGNNIISQVNNINNSSNSNYNKNNNNSSLPINVNVISTNTSTLNSSSSGNISFNSPKSDSHSVPIIKQNRFQNQTQTQPCPQSQFQSKILYQSQSNNETKNNSNSKGKSEESVNIINVNNGETSSNNLQNNSTTPRTFTSTECQTDDITPLEQTPNSINSLSNFNIPSPSREQRRRERRDRRREQQMHNSNGAQRRLSERHSMPNPPPLLGHLHPSHLHHPAGQPPPGSATMPAAMSAMLRPILPDILHSHFPPPYSAISNPCQAPPPPSLLGPPMPPPPPPHHPAAGATILTPVISTVPIPGATPMLGDGRFTLPLPIIRRSPSERSGKGCCGQWFAGPPLRALIAVVAFGGVACILGGAALGATGLSGPPSSHFTAALLMIGVGVVLVTFSGAAWRMTAPGGSQTCLGLGSGVDLGRCGRRPCSRGGGAPHGLLYPEFQHRPPPPSYQASMQEYRLRLLLLDRDRQNGVVRGSSPPPTYRSHAGSLLRAPLTIRGGGGSIGGSEYSLPPSYRSRNTTPAILSTERTIETAPSGRLLANEDLPEPSITEQLPDYSSIQLHLNCATIDVNSSSTTNNNNNSNNNNSRNNSNNNDNIGNSSTSISTENRTTTTSNNTSVGRKNKNPISSVLATSASPATKSNKTKMTINHLLTSAIVENETNNRQLQHQQQQQQQHQQLQQNPSAIVTSVSSGVTATAATKIPTKETHIKSFTNPISNLNDKYKANATKNITNNQTTSNNGSSNGNNSCQSNKELVTIVTISQSNDVITNANHNVQSSAEQIDILAHL